MAWLYRQPRSPYWWIGYRLDGRQRLKSTGKTEKADAEKVLARFESMESAKKADALNDEFYKALTKRVPLSASLKSSLTEWLEDCRRTTGANTAGRYGIVANQFCEHLKATDESPMVRDVGTADITGFLNAMTLAPSSVNLARKILSTFFNRAVAHKLCDSNPVAATKRAAQNRKRSARRAYTTKELHDMLGRANEFWRYMIHGELYTGLRMGDLICLRRDEIDLDGNCLRLRAGKTGDTINPPLAPPLRATILVRLQALGPINGDAYLWPDQAARYAAQGSGAFSNEFYCQILVPCGLVPPRSKKHRKTKQGRGARRELNDTTFHSLRHTFVSLLKSAGVSQAVAKELAGHSSDTISDLYTHCSTEHLKQAVALLPEIT